MTKTKFTPEQKIQVVLESIKTNIEVCCITQHKVRSTEYIIPEISKRITHSGMNPEST